VHASAFHPLVEDLVDAFWFGLTEGSVRDSTFKKCFSKLPPDLQKKTVEVYQQWEQEMNGTAPKRLDFRPVQTRNDYWRISITNSGARYRAICKQLGKNDWRWVWVGPHAAYNTIVDKVIQSWP